MSNLAVTHSDRRELRGYEVDELRTLRGRMESLIVALDPGEPGGADFIHGVLLNIDAADAAQSLVQRLRELVAHTTLRLSGHE